MYTRRLWHFDLFSPVCLQAASRNAWGMQKLATAEVISLKVKGPFVGIILRLLTFIVL
jgi:hypothetical protein